MKRTPEELAQTERFEQSYTNLQADVMLTIERQVCGCDYGGNSWTTRVEAEQIETLLELKPGIHLLDLGAGSGWPGLYLAKRSGCDLTLLDLPLKGLQIAAQRARNDRMSGACRITCADATNMPFGDACFDAISHSDLLCCLKEKRAVLEACRRVLRRSGRMVFTVISLAANLSPTERVSTLQAAPEFAESEVDYATLLSQTGWSVIDYQDVSKTYAESSHRQQEAIKANRDDVIAIIGEADYTNRLVRYASKVAALTEGRLQRQMFVTGIA